MRAPFLHPRLSATGVGLGATEMLVNDKTGCGPAAPGSANILVPLTAAMRHRSPETTTKRQGTSGSSRFADVGQLINKPEQTVFVERL